MFEELQIGIESTSKEILSSGSVIQFKDEDIIFHVDDLNFRITFKSDSGKARFESEIQDDKNEMKIMLYNYDNNLGIGMSEPLEIATIEDKKVYFIIKVTTLGRSKSSRLIHYTWYCEK